LYIYLLFNMYCHSLYYGVYFLLREGIAMGKTKKPESPADSQAGTSLTANPLAPDTFDMSDIPALISKLNDTILALTRQIQKEQKAHRLQSARFEDKVEEYSRQIEVLNRLVAELTEENRKLREQNNKNPGNSNLPPSSQGYGKPPVGKDQKDSEKKSATRNTKSLRKKKGGHKGGQLGSRDTGGFSAPIADETNELFHFSNQCAACPDLRECMDKHMASTGPQRNEYGIKILVVRNIHKTCSLLCPMDGKLKSGAYPAGVSGSNQYDNSIRELTIALVMRGITSYRRVQEILSYHTGTNIAVGTIHGYVVAFAQKCKELCEDIKEYLVSRSYLGADETGMRTDGHLMWVHTLCDRLATYLESNKKRGSTGMDEIGLISALGDGTVLTSDFWSAYMKYGNIVNAFCLAHLERELVAAAEREPGSANLFQELQTLLQAICHERNECVGNGIDTMDTRTLERFKRKYDKIIRNLKQSFPPVTKRPDGSTRGRIAQGKTRSLISRFETYKDSILRFAEDFSIEPSNNLSEQSLRNSKVTQAVRKCFRNEQGLENYCSIQSVFDTVGKAKTKVLAFIREIYRGQASALMRSMLGLKMQT
jgi:hypothetical protein